MLGNRLVIGLDYGTTYTGVAFCETSDALETRIQVIQDWPTAHSMIGTKEKVPSEIAYVDDGRVLWGSSIPPHIQRHLWTKLDLDSSRSGEAANIRNELNRLKQSPIDPIRIIADFLAKIKDHMIKHFDNQFGPTLWRSLPITLVVTVPAIWSDAAKDRTLRAVNLAGFSEQGLPNLKRIITTTEPEAAALYTLQSMRGGVQDDHFEVGDGFIVCDMGGGTVDLISYRVSSTSPTTIVEATIGTGDQCGGSFVDRSFIHWLESRLGGEDFKKIAECSADGCSRTSLAPKLGRMVQDFSLTAKSGFSGTEDYYLRLPAPLSGIDDWERGMCDGELHLESSDLMQMFEPCLQRTCELISEQLAAAVQSGNVSIKYVFMVGGFAESPYMSHYIKIFAATHGLQTIKPAYAWSAIVRGAAAKGLEGNGTPIKTRKCRRHYGTAVSKSFVRGEHRIKESYICSFSGQQRANNQVVWLVHKGKDLYTSKETHATTPVSLWFWAEELRSSSTDVELVACNQDLAPARASHQAVYRVAKLHVDLSEVPDSQIRRKWSPTGRGYCEINAQIHISMQSSLEFSLTVNGKKYGSVTAKYD